VNTIPPIGEERAAGDDTLSLIFPRNLPEIVSKTIFSPLINAPGWRVYVDATSLSHYFIQLFPRTPNCKSFCAVIIPYAKRCWRGRCLASFFYRRQLPQKRIGGGLLFNGVGAWGIFVDSG